MEPTPGEDAVETAEMVTKNLGHHINVVDEAMAELQRTDSSFERSFTVGKMLSNSLACYRKTAPKRKSRSMGQTWLLSHFEKFPRPPQPSAAATLISQQHQRRGTALQQQRNQDSLKAQIMISNFYQ